jgi:serine/threonine protein kinase
MPRNPWHPPSPSLPGPFANYRLRRRLGAGGMGEVWDAASKEQLWEPIAIKFFTLAGSWTAPGWVEQFREEARIGIRVSHQYIARTYGCLDLRRHDGWPPVALLMARYDLSLLDVIRDATRSRQKLPSKVAGEFGRHVGEALYTLHQDHGLVHRDIKPSNILIRLRQGQSYAGLESLAGATALVADFGVVCRAGVRPCFQLRQDGWKAPWLFDAEGEPLDPQPADPAEDLFAYGLVLQALSAVSKTEPQVPLYDYPTRLAGSANGGR